MKVKMTMRAQQTVEVIGTLVLNIPDESLAEDEIETLVDGLDLEEFIYDVPNWELDDAADPDFIHEAEVSLGSLKRVDDEADVGIVKDENGCWQRMELQQ